MQDDSPQLRLASMLTYASPLFTNMICRDHKRSFTDIAQRGMSQDLSWDTAAQQYEEVMLAAKYQW